MNYIASPEPNAETFAIIELVCLLFSFSDPTSFVMSLLLISCHISASDSSGLIFSFHFSVLSPFVDHKLLLILHIFVQ